MTDTALLTSSSDIRDEESGVFSSPYMSICPFPAVVRPMLIPTNARPTFFVNPLLFYRHCFRLTSQNDRVQRVIVMSERYVTYLCASDGRATWSFHPLSIKCCHILPGHEQLLLSFLQHSTDLLLMFDEKYASDRVNPPMATLPYFVYLLRRENPSLNIIEEQTRDCIRDSKLSKGKGETGQDGFVRRVVDGVRSYYLSLKSQLEEVREKVEASHATKLTQSFRSLQNRQGRGLSTGSDTHSAPLRFFPLDEPYTMSKGAPASSCPLLSGRVLADRLAGDRNAVFMEIDCSDEATPETPHQIVFFRRSVGVVIGTQSEVASIRDAPPEVMKSSARFGDLCVDSFGRVFFRELLTINSGCDDSQRDDDEEPSRGQSHGPFTLIAYLTLVTDAQVQLLSGDNISTTSPTRRRSTSLVHAALKNKKTTGTVRSNSLTLGSVVLSLSLPKPKLDPPTIHAKSFKDDGGEVMDIDTDKGQRNQSAGDLCRLPAVLGAPSNSEQPQTLSIAQAAMEELWVRLQQADASPQLTYQVEAFLLPFTGAVAIDTGASLFNDTSLAKMQGEYVLRQTAEDAMRRSITSKKLDVTVIIMLDAVSASAMHPLDAPVTSLETLMRLVEALRHRKDGGTSESATAARARYFKLQLEEMASHNVVVRPSAPPPSDAPPSPLKTGAIEPSTNYVSMSSAEFQEKLTGKQSKEKEKKNTRKREMEAAITRLVSDEDFGGGREQFGDVVSQFGAPWEQLMMQMRKQGKSAGVAIGPEATQKERALAKLVFLVCEQSMQRAHSLSLQSSAAAMRSKLIH